MTQIVIGNRLRTGHQRHCGSGYPAMVIASVGTSSPNDNPEAELAKAQAAQDSGADIITDHSFYGDVDAFQRLLVKRFGVLIGTVSCYELGTISRDNLGFSGLSSTKAIDLFRAQAERGIDVITIHATILREHLDLINTSNRCIPMTSKGGGIIAQFMQQTQVENPYFEKFDDILTIANNYNVCISLGTSFRPASVADGWDALTYSELETMAVLVEKASKAKVGIMIEGIGHADINSISTYVRLAKTYCMNVPYRVLPLAIDTALGLDHIASAIAGAVAVASGANLITAVSRAEHIGLPSVDDVREAVLAARVAAQCGDLAMLRDFITQEKMSRLRWQQGCTGDWRLSVHPDTAKNEIERHGAEQGTACRMCGAHCGLQAAKKIGS